MSVVTRCVVQASGGTGSWAAEKRAIEVFGKENVDALFADTLIEDDDLYRFLIEAAQDISGVDHSEALAMSKEIPPIDFEAFEPRREHLFKMADLINENDPHLTWISEGRNVWEVFNDVKYIGNTRIDPCSKILKRDFLRAYMDEHYDPQDTIIAIGIDWTEEHRYIKAAPRFEPWLLWAPLCEPPYLDKEDIKAELARIGIALPRLYEMGFPHNNCGGFCVKAGQASFKNFLEKKPEEYDQHARAEERFRQANQKDVAILRNRRKSETNPLPLIQLRSRVQAETDDTDPHDLGGCGCAL